LGGSDKTKNGFRLSITESTLEGTTGSLKIERRAVTTLHSLGSRTYVKGLGRKVLALLQKSHAR
jgi:hypothetical protein